MRKVPPGIQTMSLRGELVEPAISDAPRIFTKCGAAVLRRAGRQKEWPPDVLGMPHFAPDGTRDRRSARPSPKVALVIPVARSSTAGCLASTPNSLVSSDAPTVIGAGCTQIFLPGKGKR